jgi:hypothetical protein
LGYDYKNGMFYELIRLQGFGYWGGMFNRKVDSIEISDNG